MSLCDGTARREVPELVMLKYKYKLINTPITPAHFVIACWERSHIKLLNETVVEQLMQLLALNGLDAVPAGARSWVGARNSQTVRPGI